MDWLEKLFFVSIIIFASAIDSSHGEAMVTGTVFCDQCKDGERSLFDFPLYGVKVKLTCTDSNGQTIMSREETTNWFGNYAVRFDGVPDLSGCYAQVSSTGLGSDLGCTAEAGPPQQLRLMFRMFGMEMYGVDALLAQPAQPMSYCPKSPDPVPIPSPMVTPARPPPPPVPTPPIPVTNPPAPVLPAFPFPPGFRLPPFPPVFRLPPLPQLPPLPPMPPFPFPEATACPHGNWSMPQYKCYWRAVNPETKVSVIFGPVAMRRYGKDMTLWQGLQGRGDPYRTLLREAITSFLNSYNTLMFPYHTLGVVQHTNWALLGSPRSVLLTALRFKRANSGYGNVTCKFTPCK